MATTPYCRLYAYSMETDESMWDGAMMAGGLYV